MNKRIKIFLLSLLLSSSIYSQKTSSTTQKTDSTLAFSVSKEAIRTVNHIVIDLKACNELADSLKSEIVTHELISINDNKIIDRQDLQINNLQEQNKEMQTIIDLTDKQSKRKDRKIFVRNVSIGILAVFVVVETGYIAVKSMFIKN